MTHKLFNFLFLATTILLFSSCSQRITGTWTIQRYETVTPGQTASSSSNIGTMRFKRNGTGEKNINYQMYGMQRRDTEPFKWTITDGQYISIDSRQSDFSKTWIIIENKRKFQKWKSTDGRNNIQTLELKK